MGFRADDDRATGRDTAFVPRDAVAAASEPVRELDHRVADGLDVWLLWRERDNRVFVAVVDEMTGGRFAIPVRDGERALDVFEHPYAHAAWRGIDTAPGPAS